MTGEPFRGSGPSERRDVDRRAGDRRSGEDRRGGDRRHSADRRADAVRATARRLPDEFIRLTGEAPQRALKLVECHWGALDQHARIELAQALLAVLDQLLRPDPKITEELRDRCEDVMEQWLPRYA